MDILSGVGTLDKAMAIMSVVERSPATLGELIDQTRFTRATTHRLAGALVTHGLLRRDTAGRYTLGWRLVRLGHVAADREALAERSQPILDGLSATTGESSQLYVRNGPERVCVAVADSPHELRTIVPVGSTLPMEVGSAGRALAVDPLADGAGRWFASVEERAPGVASVSAPVVVDSLVAAAVSVSGPIERMGVDPGALHGARVSAAAVELESLLA